MLVQVGGAEALGPRAVKRGEAVASYPEVAAHLPRLLAAMDEARTADRATVIRLIREDGLPRECIPTEHLNDPAVWEALPGGHAADGDGAEPRQDDGRRPADARLEGDEQDGDHQACDGEGGAFHRPAPGLAELSEDGHIGPASRRIPSG